MALFGVVFALGAGSAAAQITVTVPDMVDEDADVSLMVGGDLEIPAGTAAGILTVAASAAPSAGTPASDSTATPGEAEDFGTIAQVQIDTPEHPATATSPLTFTVPTGHALVWNVGRDPNNAEDEVVNVAEFTVSHNILTSLTPATATGKDGVIIEDTDPQNYVLSLPTGESSIMEGAVDATVLTLRAQPPKTVNVTGVAFTRSPNNAVYTLTNPGGAALAPQELAAGGTVTVELLAGPDGNRMDETVTVTASAGTGADEVELIAQSFDVTDAHKLPMLAGDLWDSDDMEVTSAMEGAGYTLRVFPVDADGDRIAASEDWTVTLTTSGTATEGASADYTLADSVTIEENTDADTSHDTADLMVATDNDLDPNETVMISYTVMGDPANGPGTSDVMNLLTVTIADATMPKVTAKDEDAVQAVIDAALAQAGSDGFNPGDSITFSPAGMFSDPAEGYELRYDAGSGDPTKVRAGVSNGMVTLDAEAVGEGTMVTVTAITRMPPSVTFPTQTQADEVSVQFPVDVVAKPVVPVAPSAPQNLVAASGDEHVVLTWTAPASGDTPTGYEYRVTGAGVTGGWTAASSPQRVTGLTNETAYTFEVRAMNAAGSGPAASATATPTAPVLPVAPSAPQNLKATAGDGQVMLAWTAPASGDAPTGYEYRKSAGGIADAWMATSSDTGQTVTDLVNGTEYTFEVRAMNAGGPGPAASVMATPMAPADPVAPTAPQNLT
ncbi:MAG: fibronectin type III domain-containing protein, partial [Chloroflexi bacterium]|nr:fibronectin type III domain-containing protein [Chloroflexota bacterium]